MTEYEMIQRLLEESLKRIESMIKDIKKDIDCLNNDSKIINLKIADIEFRLKTIESNNINKIDKIWRYLIPVFSSLTISALTVILIKVLK